MKILLLALLLFPSLLYAQDVDNSGGTISATTAVTVSGKMDLPTLAPAKDQTKIIYTVDISAWPKDAKVLVEIFGDTDKTPFCKVTFVKGLVSDAAVICPLFGDPSSTTRQVKPVATVLQGGALSTTVKGETK